MKYSMAAISLLFSTTVTHAQTFEVGVFGTYKVFATDARFKGGDFGGVAGADQICQQEAQDAGLPGTFIAFLSTSLEDAKDRLLTPTSIELPYTLTDDEQTPVASNVADLLDGAVDNVINKNARGQQHPKGAAWTGSFLDGTERPGRTCLNWEDSSNGVRGAAGSLQDVQFWASRSVGKCGEARRLYCFETGREGVTTEDEFLDEMRDPQVTNVLVKNGVRLFLTESIDLSGQSKVVSCLGHDCVVDGSLLSPEDSGIFTDGLSATSLEFRGMTFEGFVSEDIELENPATSVILLRGEQTEATFLSCIFRNNDNVNGRGGAIHALEGVSLQIFDSVFENNSALKDGGAVFCGDQDDFIRGSLLIEGCIFRNNELIDGRNGGALGTAHLRTVKLLDSLFDQNRAISGFSGAVDIEESQAEVINCVFTGNQGEFAAMEIFNRAEILRNAIPDIENTVMAKVVGCTFENNVATDLGGGMWVGTFGQIELIDLQLSGNVADEGGAIYLEEWAPEPASNLLLQNINCHDNESGGSGGCIFMEEAADSVLIDNLECHNNVAGSSGGCLFMDEVAVTDFQSIDFQSIPDFQFTQLPVKVIIQNSDFQFNQAVLGKGGAILADGMKMNLLSNNVFASNKALENPSTDHIDLSASNDQLDPDLVCGSGNSNTFVDPSFEQGVSTARGILQTESCGTGCTSTTVIPVEFVAETCLV